MIIEVAERARATANDLLVAINTGAATSSELREMLDVTRCTAAAVSAAQTAAAELIAQRECHGDGGAEILASSAGLSQREARNQVKTTQALSQIPRLREAVQSGDVPAANARKLADAITRTSSAAVTDADVLLDQASTMRPEVFARSAQRWIHAQQGDNGASEHARQRARRFLQIYDTEDGMVNLRAQFDKITGQRIGNRLRHTAAQLFAADKNLPESERREFTQCLADALDRHTTSSPRSVARAGASSAELDADGMGNSDHCGSTEREVSGGWVADITVLAHVDDATRELIYELSDGSQLPPAVVEELSCNARWSGLIFDRHGDALWRTRSRRTVTETQWQALLTTYRGCFHCGASPSICQAHHITPYSQGGATTLKNLIMVCWNCHHRIHHDNWQIHKHSDGSHTLHPPNNTVNQPRHGPAHADDQQEPLPEPPSLRGRSPARTQNKTSRIRGRSRDPASNQDSTSDNAEKSKLTRDPAAVTLW